MAKLIFLGEKFAGRVYEFAIEKTTVGRGDHNTLTIQDASVSHAHCEILVYGTEVIVRDLGSSNGTVVDGKRLHKEEQHPLATGQVVKFGSVEARLDLTTESDTDTVTGWTAIHSHARHLQDNPKPATSIAGKLEGPSASGNDGHTLIIPPVTGVAKNEPVTDSLAKIPEGRPSGKGRLVLIALAIGLVVVLLCWLILVKYG